MYIRLEVFIINKKVKIKFISIILIILIGGLFFYINKTIDFNKTRNLIDMAQENTVYYPADKPLNLDKLHGGYISIIEETPRKEELDESTAQQLVEIISKLEVKKSKVKFILDTPDTPYYYIRLTNGNTPLDYHLELFVMFQKFEDKILIGLNSADVYETNDTTIYDTYMEIFEKNAPSK